MHRNLTFNTGTQKPLCGQSFLWFLILLFGCTTAFSQSVTGTLVGSVMDSDKASIPDAVVKVTNTDTGIISTTTSNGDGSYRISSLAVGSYTLEVTASGFKTFIQKNIVLSVDETQRVDPSLTIGAASETVTVTSAVSLVNTSTVELGRTILADEITQLPLVNRNVYQELSLTPGVMYSSSSASNPGTNPSGGNFTFGLPGQNTIANGGFDAGVGTTSYYLDGGLNMTGLRNYGNPAPNPDALQEFRVETNNFSPQYGRFSSTVVTLLTRSGTNKFHGSLFEFVRNTDFNATPWGSTLNNPLHRNQFGGAIGGPVLHDRTFFFFSYAGLRQVSGSTITGAVVPSAAERLGDFSQSSVKPNIPGTTTPFDGVNSSANCQTPTVGCIPTSYFDPTAANILKTYIPSSNTTTTKNGWIGTYSSPYDTNEYLAKIDHQLTQNNHLNVSYFTIKSTQTANAGGNIVPWTSQASITRQQNLNISDTQILGASLLNTVWLGYTRAMGARVDSPAISLGDLGSKFTIQGTPSLPDIGVSGYFTLGAAVQGPKAGSNFYSIRDVIAKTWGKHSLNFGAEWTLDKDVQITDLDNFGLFTFSTSAPKTTKNALADFITGNPTSMEQDTPDEASTNSWYYAFFLQDNYRVTPRLTLTAGVRYDFQTPPTDPADKELTFVAGEQSKVVTAAPLGLLFPGDSGVTRGTISMRLHHVAPRVGLAFDPFGDGKTSFRAAAGLFYGATSGNEWNATSNFAPFALRQVYSSIESLTNPYGNAASFPNGDPFPYTYNPSNPTFIPNASVEGAALNFQSPYSYQLNASFQRQLPGEASLTIAYVGALSHRLPIQVDVNNAVYAAGATTSQTSINSRHPYDPGVLNQIIILESNQNSSYNALQVSVNKRMSHNFLVNGYYNWSNALWSAVPNAAQAEAGPQNYSHLNEERGPSDYDQRNVANMSGVWDLNYYQGTNKLIGGVLNGWELSPIVSLHSGVPVNITTGSDKNADGYNTDRPNLVTGKNAHLNPHRNRAAAAAEWFNTAAFTANGPGLGIGPGGADGNTPRDYLRAPGFKDVDLGIFRTFRIFENWKLQTRAEATNVFNLVSLSAPTATLSSSNNGKILSAYPNRVMQFGMRLTF